MASIAFFLLISNIYIAASFASSGIGKTATLMCGLANLVIAIALTAYKLLGN